MRALLNRKNEYMHDAYVKVTIVCSVNDSCELYFTLINLAVTHICLRQCHRQQRVLMLDPESRDKDCIAFPPTIWCRLNNCYVFCRWLTIFWGYFNPTSEGHLPIKWIYYYKMAESSLFWLYVWFTIQPIVFLANNTVCKSSISLHHVF